MTQVANRNLGTLPHVLIIDDDERISSLVSRFLSENDFVVSVAHSAAQAREIMSRLAFDALVVDIMMPGESGLEFTQSLREKNDIPVILLTALGEADDRIKGLQTGADDYLPKPFEPRELVLRLQAILRRRPQPMKAQTTFRMGRWMYDPELNELRTDTESVRLTTAEGTLLKALASRHGNVISREDLALMCDVDPNTRTIDVQVTRLRSKLEDDSKVPRYLQTVRGTGYRLLIDNE